MFKNSPILATFCHLLELTRLITTRVINLYFLTVSKKTLCILWFSVDQYLIVNTSHTAITNPKNSRGDVCGIGAEHDKPSLSRYK